MGFSGLKLDIMSWFRWRRFRRDLPIFLNLLNPQKGDVILDVGAGTGVIASEVSRHCDEVFALEPVVQRVDYIKKKFPEVKAFRGLAENIPFPESYFTKIYVVNAFHHFGNPDSALAEFDRILKSDGFVLIQEMNPEGGLARMEKRFTKLNFQTPESLQEKMRAVGFQIKKLEKTKQAFFLSCQKT